MNAYPYAPSPSGVYALSRDGAELMRGSEGNVWAYLHRHHSFSVSRALLHEGFALAPVERPLVWDCFGCRRVELVVNDQGAASPDAYLEGDSEPCIHCSSNAFVRPLRPGEPAPPFCPPEES